MLLSLSQLVKEYTHFTIENKRIQIPYSMVWLPNDPFDPTQVTRTTRFKQYAGKGTPAEIKTALTKTAARHKFDLITATSAQIHQFMLKHGIGVDCSGFVYNLLDSYLQKTHGINLGQHILLFSGLKGELERRLFFFKRVRRCSAQTLTSKLNTIKVSAVKDMQPGDMIRLTLPTWTGKHIAVITQVTKHKLVYAHSGEHSELRGPHIATIEIKHPEKGLESQHWLEKHESGISYKKHAFHPEKGDSVRRLKVLAKD